VSNPKLALRARVGVAPGDRLYVDDLDGYVPLPLVLEKFATDAGVIEGNIEPQHLDLRWRGGVLSGLRGDLSLRRLRLAHQVGRPIAFGDALLSFAGDSSPWRAEIRDDGGPVRLSGQLSLGADGAYALDLLAGPRESDSAQGRVLATLGPADAEGRHRLSLSGSL
jgi:hypothetical protein